MGRRSQRTAAPKGGISVLTIFEKHPTADAYRVGGFYSPYALVATEKRFSDAELAADYWFDNSIYVSEAANLLSCHERYMKAALASFKEAERRCTILHRFAALPHFDE